MNIGNVLSLADGISTAQIALQKAGIEYDYYLASEIDKYAIKTTQKNFPKTIQLGNIYDVDVSKIPFKIDLILCGFPCQSFSLAGKQKKFDDARGQIFFQGMKIVSQLRKKNPDVKVLFENVRMDKHSEGIISTMFGADAVKIDSGLVCAQTRKRNYWQNISGSIVQPKDREIMLQDILEEAVDVKYHLSDAVLARINTDEVYKRLAELKLKKDKSRAIISSVGRTTDREYFTKNQGQLIQVNPAKEYGTSPRQQNRKYDSAGKAPTLTDRRSGETNVVCKINNSQDGKDFAIQGKSQSLTPGHFNVPKIVLVGAVRGRYEEDGSTSQRIELNGSNGSKSIALTTVEKDNIIAHSTIGVVNAYGTMRSLDDKSLNIDANYYKGLDNHAQRTHIASLTEQEIVVHNLQPCNGKGQGGKGHIMRYPGNKAYCLDTGNCQAVEYDLIIRRLTPIEVCRLQGLPDDYFYKNSRQILSDTQIYKCVGNAWQSDTVAYILSYLNTDTDEEEC